MRVTASLIVPMLLLAGCLSGEPADEHAATDVIDPSSWAPLSEPTYSLGDVLTLRVPGFDRTRLHVDVQLPDGDGPWPLVLEYTPYSILGEETSAIQWGLPGAAATYYTERGYAFGVAHVRGTGQSEGCLTVGGPEEGLDGAALVEALAAEPWSNGKIGMRGASYVGTTPLETAVHNPPGLAAIAPVAAVTEWYKYYFENGEQRLLGGQSGADSAFWVGIGVIPGLRTGTVDAMDAVCPAEMAVNQLGQDDYNDYWKARNHGAEAGNITVPTLFVQGWDDTNVPPSMIPSAWPALAGEKRAWFTQQGHGYPKASTRYMEYELRWFDHYLKGLDNGALALPNVIIEHDDGSFRAEETWPPADAAMLRLWLGDGTFSTTPPDNGTASYQNLASSTPGATNELTFTWQVPDGFVIAGDPILHLAATTDRTDGQFAAYLYGDDIEITRGHLDARHRDSLEAGTDVPIGEVVAYEFALRTIDDMVPNGTELRLDLFSNDPDIYPDPLAQGATITIALGADGSWIDLPVVPLRATVPSIEEIAPLLFL